MKFAPVLFLILACCFTLNPVSAQVTVSGTVFDSSKRYVVPEVEVLTSSGKQVQTDSVGRYEITLQPGDSLRFFYNGKYTKPFTAGDIPDAMAFDISIHSTVKNKYKLLKGVTVYSNSYRQDSLERWQKLDRYFGSAGGGAETSYSPGGAAGIDPGELIKLFQFRRNKTRRAFQEQLIEAEQERYVDYRFSRETVKRITGLTGEFLEVFRNIYRPPYSFVQNSTQLQFYDYILQAADEFKKNNGIGQ